MLSYLVHVVRQDKIRKKVRGAVIANHIIHTIIVSNRGSGCKPTKQSKYEKESKV